MVSVSFEIMEFFSRDPVFKHCQKDNAFWAAVGFSHDFIKKSLKPINWFISCHFVNSLLFDCFIEFIFDCRMLLKNCCLQEFFSVNFNSDCFGETEAVSWAS